MRRLVMLATLPLLMAFSGCATYGAYTGSSTYEGGDANGVTVYKTIYSSQAQVDTEATLHCKKFKKIARRLSCSSILVNSCTYACDEPPRQSQKGSDTANAEKPSHSPSKQTKPPSAEKASKSTGSGFFVSRLGHLVTNQHVTQDCSKITVRSAAFGTSEASVVGMDATNDLALIRTEEKPATVARFRSGNVVQAGENIVAIGFPLTGLLASQPNVTTGIISATAGLLNDTRHFQITAPVQQGSSGGPLLDSSGRVVGVIVSKLSALWLAKTTGDIPQNINFAIKASVVKSFLESHRVKWRGSKSSKKLSTPQIMEKARDFTALVECWK